MQGSSNTVNAMEYIRPFATFKLNKSKQTVLVDVTTIKHAKEYSDYVLLSTTYDNYYVDDTPSAIKDKIKEAWKDFIPLINMVDNKNEQL